MNTKSLYFVLLFATGFTLCGCQNSSRLDGLVPASGVVMYENNPVEGAQITFAPVSGSGEKRMATATTDAKGRFIMMSLNPGDGVFPGEYAVSIKKIELMGEPKKETLPDGTVIERGRTDDRVIEKLPLKYGSGKTSELKVVVSEKGDKNIEFLLEGELDETPRLPAGPPRRR